MSAEARTIVEGLMRHHYASQATATTVRDANYHYEMAEWFKTYLAAN